MRTASNYDIPIVEPLSILFGVFNLTTLKSQVLSIEDTVILSTMPVAVKWVSTF
jgi:hypothetical protein